MVVPSPSWRNSLYPQHETVPAAPNDARVVLPNADVDRVGDVLHEHGRARRDLETVAELAADVGSDPST